MSRKIKKIVLRTLGTLATFLVVVALAGYLVLQFWFLPKYNAGRPKDEQMSVVEVLGLAGQLADKEVIENIQNMDAGSAKDVLSVMQEVEKELEDEPQDMPSKKPATTDVTWKQNVWSDEVGISKEVVEERKAEHEEKVRKAEEETKKATTSKKQGTAYDRIMATASKEEIAAGMAILAKVDMGKVNALRSTGKTAELKKYITSVLTSSEIRTALRLYNKYAYLL